MTFGERLVQYRKRSNLTQKELAENIGITPTRLNYWEKDKRQPDVENIRILASALDVSADDLLGISENEKSPAPEGTEDDAKVQKVVAGLTHLLEDAGWIEPGGDLTDAQLRALSSYVIAIHFYFKGDI